ncbi:MAG: Permease of the drug/metabolite transporter (DMT) superfamily [uncultured Pyrinomonadaceae bacterium]|uniref:Permease of the drug/metabolite transporter (DMT) superfamily n=1 Tax=uncultured Pyrinomonadaceae bacterium TaxID=2283094 RepID=A0A6J4NQN1_9BACT|nr:MAG: Permease of the drug/metabolite transporter (DMT) superfamily [uncultured Pyrinomonadaceae bacterium]
MREVTKTNHNIKHFSVLLPAAFAAVYIFWGSTYLAIKYAIETLPPFLMAGSRFIFAGSILYIWARLSKDYEKPSLKHWRTSFIVGTLLLLGGNGGVVLAQHYISSSLAALLVATEPFWIVLLGWLWLKGARPNWKVALGLLIGFVGVYLLIGGQSSSTESGTGQIFGAFLVIIAAFSWATGSMYGLRATTPKSSALTAGMQMLSGGLVLTLVGTIKGEWTSFSVGDVSANSWFALAYLIIFGSLIGFTAYSWLLKNAAPAMVATYAYVNPVIAVFLGWIIAGESFTMQMLVGAGVIIGSVALITSHDKGEENSTKETEIHESNTPTGNCKTLSASA